MDEKKRKYVFAILSGLTLLNILAWTVVWDLSRPQTFKINFFDVGQGDSIFIETPEKQQILIDGGPSSIILEKLAKKMSFKDKTIDLIILTHPDSDHINGLINVLKKYRVKNILWTGVIKNSSEYYKEWVKSINNENANIFIAQAGQKIYCSTKETKPANQCYFEIIYPFKNMEGKKVEESNNSSIIIMAIFGNKSFLFTDDAPTTTENEIIKEKIKLNADVLKVAHHGSKYSSSEEFISAVSPQIAVISVGKNNKYGLPHQKTLDTLNKYGIKVLRTDLMGDIEIISDGNSLKITN